MKGVRHEWRGGSPEPEFSSDSSGEEIVTNISTDPGLFVVNFIIDPELRIYANISTDRLPTQFGNRTQGHHVTAYRTLFDLIAAGMDGQEPEQAIVSLGEIARCYLPESSLAHIEDIKAQCLSVLADENISRDERKSLTALIRRDNPELAERVKLSIKRGHLSVLSQYAGGIATTIVTDTNRLEEMTFRSDGPGDPKEGSRVKKAVAELASINRELLVPEEFDTDTFVERIAGLMEDLYDYPAVVAIGEEIAMHDTEILCLSSARHAVIVFNAFPNIAGVLGEEKELAIEQFCEKVYANQGWNGATERLQPFDLGNYIAGVGQFLKPGFMSMSRVAFKPPPATDLDRDFNPEFTNWGHH